MTTRSSAAILFGLAGILLVLGGILILPTAQAVIPGLMSYQARLLDGRGDPLAGNFDLVFALYDAKENGQRLWEETRNLTLVDGVLDVMLGEVEKLNEDAFDAEELWLEVHVPQGGFTFPRVQITPTSFAFRVKSLEGSRGGTVSGPTTVDGSLAVTGPATVHSLTTQQALTVGGTLNLPDGIQLYSTAGTLSIISGASTITVDPSGAITITGNSDLSLHADGDLTLEGTNVNVTATLSCTIEAGLDAEFRGGGTTIVQGSMVEIN